jgi:hypothetical protein
MKSRQWVPMVAILFGVAALAFGQRNHVGPKPVAPPKHPVARGVDRSPGVMEESAVLRDIEDQLKILYQFNTGMEPEPSTGEQRSPNSLPTMDEAAKRAGLPD